jgi:ATPase subunit of ABC transporter with duplicated ATPase domains
LFLSLDFGVFCQVDQSPPDRVPECFLLELRRADRLDCALEFAKCRSDMSQPSNVFLIGPMGVGKSTIGRMLATALDKPFYDSDREIEAATGADIPWIFDVEGEAGFRIREERMIDTLTQREGIVMATGAEQSCRQIAAKICMPAAQSST